MAVTSKGSKWERNESCYIIIAFIPLLNWIAFLYVGLTANVKRWIYWSIFYATPLILIIYLLNFEDSSRVHLIIDRYYNLYYYLVQIMGIIHVFWIRKEYLVRVEALQERKIILAKDEVKAILEKNKLFNSAKDTSEVKGNKFSEIKNDTLSREEPAIDHVINTKEKADNILAKDTKRTSNIININTAPENELASLPSIGLILAKKAINHRETKGYFNSIDEFAEILSLKPHVLERIKPLIVVDKIEFNHKTDEFSSKGGRIVDF